MTKFTRFSNVTFIRRTAGHALAARVLALSVESAQPMDPMNRRRFLLSLPTAALASASASAMFSTANSSSASGGPAEFEFNEATFRQLSGWMQSGQESSVSITEKYIGRIEALDRKGPKLRSIIELNPDALAIARALDAERKSKGPRSPLHGIPILLKDNIATGDRMNTTAGSMAFKGVPAAGDSLVAKKLRDAGAVLLGKANLSEWANFRSSHSSSGWSARGGQCLNPYVLDRNPSGSSSGSAVAAAANLCAGAIGTETDGSIVSPSNNTCLVGLKPTVGLVSRHGIIPIAHSQDTAGPMTRTVEDAALLLGILAGADSSDPATAQAPRAPVNYAQFLDPHGLKGARIGVSRKGLFGFSQGADRTIEQAIETMRQAGAIIIDPADIPGIEHLGARELDLLLFEFKNDINEYLAGFGKNLPVRSLKDLIAFNDAHKEVEMPYFGQEFFVMAEAKGPLTTPAYLEALSTCQQRSRQEGIDAVMDKLKLDALVAPTGSPASLIDLVNGDYGSGGASSPAAIAGYPHITVPAGFYFELPLGLSFFGKPFSEPALIKLAYAFEQLTHHRRAPKFLPTAPTRPDSAA